MVPVGNGKRQKMGKENMRVKIVGYRKIASAAKYISHLIIISHSFYCSLRSFHTFQSVVALSCDLVPFCKLFFLLPQMKLFVMGHSDK